MTVRGGGIDQVLIRLEGCVEFIYDAAKTGREISLSGFVSWSSKWKDGQVGAGFALIFHPTTTAAGTAFYGVCG